MVEPVIYDEFGDNIEDWRLQHHYPTEYVKSWKDYDTAGRDSKYTDLCSKCDNRFFNTKMYF